MCPSVYIPYAVPVLSTDTNAISSTSLFHSSVCTAFLSFSPTPAVLPTVCMVAGVLLHQQPQLWRRCQTTVSAPTVRLPPVGPAFRTEISIPVITMTEMSRCAACVAHCSRLASLPDSVWFTAGTRLDRPDQRGVAAGFVVTNSSSAIRLASLAAAHNAVQRVRPDF
jgi:hypothetical protein